MARNLSTSLLVVAFCMVFLGVTTSVRLTQFTATISTPEMLTEFFNGSHMNSPVLIKPGANENILSLPKRVARSLHLYYSISFVDEHNNFVELSDSSEKLVDAELYSGENLLNGLPKNFQTYRIKVLDSITLTEADLHDISQWKQAESIQLFGTHNITNYDVIGPLLQSKLFGLKNMQQFVVTPYA